MLELEHLTNRLNFWEDEVFMAVNPIHAQQVTYSNAVNTSKSRDDEIRNYESNKYAQTNTVAAESKKDLSKVRNVKNEKKVKLNNDNKKKKKQSQNQSQDQNDGSSTIDIRL